MSPNARRSSIVRIQSSASKGSTVLVKVQIHLMKSGNVGLAFLPENLEELSNGHVLWWRWRRGNVALWMLLLSSSLSSPTLFLWLADVANLRVGKGAVVGSVHHPVWSCKVKQ